jgi:hypothetical protein
MICAGDGDARLFIALTTLTSKMKRGNFMLLLPRQLLALFFC